MSDKKVSCEDINVSTQSRSTRRKPALPNIHPDDAKDKVFTAILKALLKKGNKPSSPKELANDIVKHKYATLGGATPFATVSSRISQHFKRAAEHNPPRAPLLVKHVDQKHSRKINYSLITPGDNAKPTSASASTTYKSYLASSQHPLAQQHELSTLAESDEQSSHASNISSDKDQQHPNGISHGTTELRPASRSGNKSTPVSTRKSLRRRPRTRNSSGDKRQYHHSDSDHELSLPESKRTRRDSSITTSLHPSNDHHNLNRDNHHHHHAMHATKSPTDDDDDSEADYSDYYEEMMKGDETMAHIEIARRRSSIFRRPSTTVNSGTTSTITPNSNNNNNSTTTDSPKLVGRKLSLPLNGLLGDNEFWTPYTFEQDLANDATFIPDTHHASHQQQVPLNIVSPETISETELDLYFGGPTFSDAHGNNNKLYTYSGRTSRKSFCAASNGKEASLLHRALMANSTGEAIGTSGGQPVESTVSDGDDDEEDEEDDSIQPPIQRRKSWPLTAHAISQSPEFLDSRAFLEQVGALNNSDNSNNNNNIMEAESTQPQPHVQLSKRMDGGGGDDNNNDNKEKHIGSSNDATITATAATESLKVNDSTIPFSKIYSQNGHCFTITKKLVDNNLLCYELDSPDDIPDTKVLRFIASNDYASEHVALRTRHADAEKHHPEHFYLVEGCVNATQLRKAAHPVLGKGSFDAAAEVVEGRLVVTLTKGSMECRGAWVTLTRARELVDEFEIESSPGLAKLLGDDPMGENDLKRRKSSTHQSLDGTTPTSLISGTTNLSASVSSDEADDDEFVQFEEDESAPTPISTETDKSKTAKNETSTSSVTSASATTPPTPASTTDPSVNTQTLNLAALQHLMAVFPSLAQLNPTLDLARTFTSYMQAVAKATSGSPTPSSSSTTPLLGFDLKSALSRFPAMDALLKKDSPLPTPPPPQLTAGQSSPTSPSSYAPHETDTTKMYPTTSTNPPMYITVIDNVTVCVATLNVPGNDNGDKTYKILRRLDTGYVNGSSLLMAGGIDTERERSMILSFEMERIRIPNRSSELCGTWIPLRRAQELAVTCSIQNRLGAFLSDRVESYFSPTIPISRGVSGVRGVKPIMGVRRSSSSHDLGNNKNVLMMSAAAAASGLTQEKPDSSTQLQQLLLSHPYKTLKLADGGGHSSLSMLKAPLLGSFDRTADLRQKRSISVINSRRPHSNGDDGISEIAVDTKKQPRRQRPRDADIDILNDDDMDDSHSDDADTESDTDVKEVRQRMKRMRDAAIDAMETGQSMDLQELLSRASVPIVQPMRQPPSIQLRGTTNTNIKRRRLFDIDEEGNAPSAFRKPANFLPHGRRRPPSVIATPHGLHGGKLTTSMIKKSASWNGALPLPRNNIVLPGTKKTANGSKRKKAQKKDVLNNHVVEHHDGDKKLGPQPTTKTTTTALMTPVAVAITTPSPPTPMPVSLPSPPSSLPISTAEDSKTIDNGGTLVPDHQPTLIDTTMMVSKASVSDEDEDEEIDIGGSDDDDDVR